jgi:hypothetical protein
MGIFQQLSHPSDVFGLKLEGLTVNMENSVNRVLFFCPVLLASHFVLAVAGAMIVGFLPEALLSKLYYNSGLEPYSPVIAAAALLLGYLVGFRLLSLRTATWTWVPGVLWLLVGVQQLTSHWGASWSPEKTRWGYAIANLLARP